MGRLFCLGKRLYDIGMSKLTTRALSSQTWDDFAALVAANNGVWGGCWCMHFHAEGTGKDRAPAQNQADKKARVERGEAHAALVYDGEKCVGWCQFGPTDELPRIKNRKMYEANLQGLPDWRITCFYVGKGHRGKGVSDAALAGALALIAAAGGGLVESYPEDVAGRKVSASFLHNGVAHLFDRHGFTRERKIGKDRWVVRRQVEAA